MPNPPALVLVRPQLGENIGAAARAMHNFGLRDLRLVAPKNGWPNPRALDMAASGASVVEAAKVYETLPEALADIQVAYALTARPRDMALRTLTPAQAAAELHSQPKTALLFGPERTGLTNEDLVLCDAVVTIPTPAENPSLNLSQAAVVMAYEWFRHRASGPGLQKEGLLETEAQSPATRSELQGFFDQMEEYLDAVNHFRTPDKKTVMWQNLRNLFTRARPSEQEVRTLRGVIRALYLRRKQEG